MFSVAIGFYGKTGNTVVQYIIIPAYTLIHAGNMLAILILVFVEVFVFPPVTCFITSFCIIPILTKYVIDIK